MLQAFHLPCEATSSRPYTARYRPRLCGDWPWVGAPVLVAANEYSEETGLRQNSTTGTNLNPPKVGRFSTQRAQRQLLRCLSRNTP